jgi:hypothetical protein
MQDIGSIDFIVPSGDIALRINFRGGLHALRKALEAAIRAASAI